MPTKDEIKSRTKQWKSMNFEASKNFDSAGKSADQGVSGAKQAGVNVIKAIGLVISVVFHAIHLVCVWIATATLVIAAGAAKTAGVLSDTDYEGTSAWREKCARTEKGKRVAEAVVAREEFAEYDNIAV